MCVEWRGDWEEAQEDLIAYKIVQKAEDGSYQSPCPVEGRASQDGRPVGAMFTYPLNERVVSDEPGIYCLASGVRIDGRDGQVVLVVRIPKGTKYRRGRASLPIKGGGSTEFQTINALCVVTLREYKETAYPYYTTYATSSTTTSTWSYTTI